MRATVGDRIVTASGVVGGAVRDGVITECRGPDGTPPYRVRWSDSGEETLIFPGSDTFVQGGGETVPGGGEAAADRSGGAPQADEVADDGTRRRTLTWHVEVTLVESAGSTTAEATVVGPPQTLRAVGHARKAPEDAEVPVIGDELAAGRALRRLADRLLEVAEKEVSSSVGHKAHVHG
ncbi:dsRBD fold-containing protein [Antribacter gilvus]|uniref:dsRBD fold-containing protein n=1 Tax=Antribacter gilvus TaxID=2304675 RepID=UPI000F76B1BA|nr:dsRBD fold-containing protein [Antribacter gilvus]